MEHLIQQGSSQIDKDLSALFPDDTEEVEDGE